MHEQNGAESIIQYVSKTVGRGVDNGKLLYSTQSYAARHPSISGAIHV